MKRWILVASGKGGVGKSLIARLLAEMKRQANPDTWLVDGDGHVGQLVQYLGIRDDQGKLVRGQPGNVGVATLALHDWRDEAGMHEILQGLIAPLRSATADVVADLPAGSLAALTMLERDAVSRPAPNVWASGRPSLSRFRRFWHHACRSPMPSRSDRATMSSPFARSFGATTAIIDAGWDPNCAPSSSAAAAAKSSSRACAAGSSSISTRGICRSPLPRGRAC